MKSYRDYDKDYIGSSDVAAVTMIGPCDCELVARVIKFGGDGDYNAYIVDEKAKIGEHYEEVARFNIWAKVVDDSAIQREFHADEIVVYRAGLYGCIIQLIGENALKLSW